MFFKQPRLISYSIIPVIINFIIYTGIFVLSYRWLLNWTRSMSGAGSPDPTSWNVLLHVLLLILGFIVLLVVCYFLFTILGGIVTAPFNENTSRIVEEKITGEKLITNLGFWKDNFLSIKAEMQKLLFYFSILFIFFLMNFIPLIGNSVSIVLGIIFSFYFNALDFLDYPMQRKLMSFKQKLVVTQRGGMITYGFGAMAFMMMFFPIVNVFMKPILVVAGTSLYWEKPAYSSFEHKLKNMLES